MLVTVEGQGSPLLLALTSMPKKVELSPVGGNVRSEDASWQKDGLDANTVTTTIASTMGNCCFTGKSSFDPKVDSKTTAPNSAQFHFGNFVRIL
jgi:hypothetical protein